MHNWSEQSKWSVYEVIHINDGSRDFPLQVNTCDHEMANEF